MGFARRAVVVIKARWLSN